uniref:Uncharacterized protein n=1 Tax=Rhizophora mucronata TaxID=61149 RepID=A0A2P2P7M8_RHIMU
MLITSRKANIRKNRRRWLRFFRLHRYYMMC